MITNVYIDGFNLYNGAVKGTRWKWLDIVAMCTTLLPQHQIKRIRYFTARVIGFPHNPDAPTRQDTYLRALKTLPSVEVHADGWFATHPAFYPQFPLVYQEPNKAPLLVQVQRNEEKRTDVDLATYLLLDCFKKDADEFVVVSNDSDLVCPIEKIRTEFGKQVGVINPHKQPKMSRHLKAVASWHIDNINRSVLKKCQLPLTLVDANGTITKPSTW